MIGIKGNGGVESKGTKFLIENYKAETDAVSTTITIMESIPSILLIYHAYS